MLTSIPDSWLVTIPNTVASTFSDVIGTHKLLRSGTSGGQPTWVSNSAVTPFVRVSWSTSQQKWELRITSSSGTNIFRKANTGLEQLVYWLANTFDLSVNVGGNFPSSLTISPGTLDPETDHSPADILRYLLVSVGAGTLPESNSEWPIACDQELDNPDNTITTYDTMGRIDGVMQPTGEIEEHYGFQIRLRSSLHTNGYAKLKGIRRHLAAGIEDNQVVIGTSIYNVQCVTNLGSINRLGKDLANSRRRLFTLNGTIVVTQL